MNKEIILVLGAGRSSAGLIRYLLEHAEKDQTEVWVADLHLASAEKRIAGSAWGKAFELKSGDDLSLRSLLRESSLVISLLPPDQHHHVAVLALQEKKSLLTASYVNEAIRETGKAFEKEGLLLLMECGLDPGIDHMSAMQEIEKIKAEGAELISFRSYTGGLVAPESDNNPWHYKVSWNPRNVVLAGQGTAQYIEEGEYKYIPYKELFARTTPIRVSGHGTFEAYPNRDSLSYRPVYGLENLPTFIRGTLRVPPYCAAWNLLVQLNMTDDAIIIQESEKMTYAAFTKFFLPASSETDLRKRVATHLDIPLSDQRMAMLDFLGLFSEEKINLKNATPAKVIQQCIEQKWKLEAGDKDMIVMVHEFGCRKENHMQTIQSSLVVIGEDDTYTAMAKTVGLPLGIAARKILKKEIQLKGLQIPVLKEIYQPILEELKQYGVIFKTEVR